MPPDPAHGPPTNGTGIGLALIAAAGFSTVAALVKLAAAEFHILQILFVRQVCVFLSAVPTTARGFPAGLHTRQPTLHGLRLLGAFSGLLCSVWALTLLPLSTAITLGFAQVFFVALLARAALGAVAVGFSGVVVVMRPGVDGLLNTGALVALAAAPCWPGSRSSSVCARHCPCPGSEPHPICAAHCCSQASARCRQSDNESASRHCVPARPAL